MLMCAGLCRRDPDAFAQGSTLQPYLFTQAIRPDAALSSLLHQHCAAALGDDKALQGFNVTADSFYSSQVCNLHQAQPERAGHKNCHDKFAATGLGISADHLPFCQSCTCHCPEYHIEGFMKSLYQWPRGT